MTQQYFLSNPRLNLCQVKNELQMHPKNVVTFLNDPVIIR